MYVCIIIDETDEFKKRSLVNLYKVVMMGMDNFVNES